jgi:predicted transport protein
VEPPFQNLTFGDAISPSTEKEIPESSQYTEEFHLEGCGENVKDIYGKLKNTFLSVKSTLRFNPVKYYVGVRDIKNIAAIRFRKRKLLVEFDLSEDEVNKMMEPKYHHKIRLYSSRGPMVEIDDMSHWDEIQKLISKVMEKHQDA